MKSEINPRVAVACVAGVLAVAALAWWFGTSTPATGNAAPPAMPDHVAAEFQQRMSGAGKNAGAPGKLAAPGSPAKPGAPTAKWY
jgi:hypothetical protein